MEVVVTPPYEYRLFDGVNYTDIGDEIIKEVEDPITGKFTKTAMKVIRKDSSGNPVYQQNPLKDTGIVLSNFEIKQFRYDIRFR